MLKVGYPGHEIAGDFTVKFLNKNTVNHEVSCEIAMAKL